MPDSKWSMVQKDRQIWVSEEIRLPFILFALFVVIPILEIAAFIQVGSLIGLLPTLGSIVLTAVIGAFLVRRQGLQTLQEAQQASAQGELPVGPLFHGVFILIAGLLLLTPGFITDAIGFVLLVPPLRKIIGANIWATLKDKVEIHTTTGHYPGTEPPNDARAPGPVIDGVAEDITEKSEDNGTSSAKSPWKNINHTGQ